MTASAKSLQKGEYIFREGDPSDSAYVVKSGTIVIAKQKGNSEIELAQLNSGQMFGEMSFFDGKTRSAGARATSDSVVIVLPFENLSRQFASFPQWLKVMVKTINDNLREANKRIKNFEQGSNDKILKFDSYAITKLSAILTLTALKHGTKQPDGSVVLSGSVLRNYTIQLFQEPTNKMQKLVDLLTQMNHLKTEELSEQRTQIHIFNLTMLLDFVDFYNRWLFTEDSKRTLVTTADLRLLKALLHFGKDTEPDAKGLSKINLNIVQKDSANSFGAAITLNHWGDLIEKKLCTNQMSEPDGIFVYCDMAEIKRITPFWEIVCFIEAAENSNGAKTAA